MGTRSQTVHTQTHFARVPKILTWLEVRIGRCSCSSLRLEYKKKRDRYRVTTIASLAQGWGRYLKIPVPPPPPRQTQPLYTFAPVQILHDGVYISLPIDGPQHVRRETTHLLCCRVTALLDDTSDAEYRKRTWMKARVASTAGSARTAAPARRDRVRISNQVRGREREREKEPNAAEMRLHTEERAHARVSLRGEKSTGSPARSLVGLYKLRRGATAAAATPSLSFLEALYRAATQRAISPPLSPTRLSLCLFSSAREGAAENRNRLGVGEWGRESEWERWAIYMRDRFVGRIYAVFVGVVARVI